MAANRVNQFRTEKGKETISCNGYCFRFARTGVDGARYWRCLEDACSGRAVTDPDYMQDFQLRTQHSHPNNQTEATVRGVRKTLRHRAADELTSMPEMYRNE